MRSRLISVVAATLLVASAGSATAGRPDPPGAADANHCITELGVDLNELYGMSEQFRTFECRTISAGERWIPWLIWITDDAADNVFPPGYVPAEQAPIDDFLAKLVEVKVIVDGGTKHERVHTFDPSEMVRTDIDAQQILPGAVDLPYPTASLLPLMPPVSLGEHTFEPIIVLSAQHCDGFGPDPELQCLPAGETTFFVRPLTITPPEH